MLNIPLNEKEEFYLKRMAALSYLYGSDKSFVSQPFIFLVQDKSEALEKNPPDNFKFLSTEIGYLEYKNPNEEYPQHYNSVEELVANSLGLDVDIPRKIEKYNLKAEKENRLEFVSFDVAEASGVVPGSDEKIYDIKDYLNAYGIDPSKVTFFLHTGDLITKSVAFSYKGAQEERNTIFYPGNSPLIQAQTSSSNEFSAIMNFLMKCGQQLLLEETRGTSCITKYRKSPKEISEWFDSHPQEEIIVAQYDFELPRRLSEDNQRHPVKLTVKAKSVQLHEDFYNLVVRVIGETDDGKIKDIRYPPYDMFTAALDRDDGPFRLLNYIRYV